MTAYYNEIDPYAAQWLRNLIDAGHIASGIVDARSIEDVHPRDLDGFTQCHFFAGIGVWSYALRLAGWSDNRPVWTGSCPCQPFSTAGKGAGFADERHLWPAWHNLIRECRPAVIFGEQVASSDVGPWLDLVQDDLEAMDHAFGAVAFPSAGVGAPHIRDRLYWVANADGDGRQPRRKGRQTVGHRPAVEPDRGARGMGNSASIRCAQPWHSRAVHGTHSAQSEHGQEDGAHGSGNLGAARRLADANGWDASAERQQRCGEQRQQPQDGGSVSLAAAGPTNGLWRAADWLLCRDGRWRPVEPGSFPLVDGAPARVGRLRAYGNAINAQAAATFVMAAMEARGS